MKKIIKIISISLLLLFLNFLNLVNANEKIKIGLLVPMTGENKDLGSSIIKAVSLAVKDIDNDLIEIYPKDTANKANQTLRSAFELKQIGVKKRVFFKLFLSKNFFIVLNCEVEFIPAEITFSGKSKVLFVKDKKVKSFISSK